MSEASDAIRQRRMEAMERQQAEDERFVAELTQKLKPLARRAADRMALFDYPEDSYSFAGVQKIDGEEYAAWNLYSTGADYGNHRVMLLDNGEIHGIKPGVKEDSIVTSLERIIGYPVNPLAPPQPKKKRRWGR
jgi:hypothetical protein